MSISYIRTDSAIPDKSSPSFSPAPKAVVLVFTMEKGLVPDGQLLFEINDIIFSLYIVSSISVWLKKNAHVHELC